MLTRAAIAALLVSSYVSLALAQQPTVPAAGIGTGALKWRHIGPSSYGGRIDDIEAVADQPSVIFVATASGGIFKTVNAGVTWAPVFDADGGSLSIGDVAIAPSDRNVVWAGTGEPNNRQSSSWGDGVYKSLDGGLTWRHMGLKESHHVGRIVIHPSNPDVVYVAALGHLWGANDERGLFKTVDGGKTWRKVLFINADTGLVDVAIDRDGRTLFAAAYERRRRAWGYVGGGPNGGLFRSLDGGETWERLGNGLPAGTVGRIGVEIAKSDPNIVYAVYEHKSGGVFRSADRGATWVRMNPLNPRASYYSQVRIDPTNAHKVWLLAGTLAVSIDDGKTFTTEGTGERIHVDHHALWIDPKNPDHLMLGNDGGLYFSHDGSRHWNFIDNLPIGQYYDIGVDRRDPYWIYGGTQDNGTWGIPSRTSNLVGILNSDVVNIAYGDGFYTLPDPTDPRYVYANSQSGRTYLVDLETKEERGIRPVPADPKEVYRFNWSTPMLISPHDPKVVYYGGNKLFRTADRGQTWREISKDLTLNQDWKKLPLLGPERSADTLSRDDGVSDFGTITTIDESPRQAGVLYVGTDDGQVQLTRDGGTTWTNLTSRFSLPGPRWVSRVVASRASAGAAYVVFDGHQDDDFKPYIFKTTDFGATWSSASGDMPDGMVVNALVEHPRNAKLLFAGTEFGLFYTVDGGARWTHARGNLPRVPVDDIVIEERSNDVVLGTHGRSIIVLDDIGMLEHVDDASGEVHLFPIRPATAHYEARMLPVPGAAKFAGPNPDYGALITYSLRSDPPAQKPDAKAPVVKIKVQDAGGQVVRELEAPDRKGIQRVAWDLRHALGIPFKGEGSDGWFGVIKGPFVAPGVYTVTLTARGRDVTQKVTVNADPRTRSNPESLRLRTSAGLALNDLLRAYDDAASAVRQVDQEMEALKTLLDAQPKVAPELRATFDDMWKRFQETKEKFRGGGFGGPRFQITDLGQSLQASSNAPTEAQTRLIAQLTADLTTHIARLNALITTDLPALQGRVRASGVAAAKLEAVRPPKTP